MPISVLVYVGGQVLQQINGGPSYSGGTTLHLTMERGITLDQLQVLISNAAGMVSTHMTITFRYPSVRFPNLAYEYVGIELVDNSGVDLIIDVHGEVPGYVPVLFTEAITGQRQQPYHIVEQQHPEDESDTSSFEDVDVGLDTEELEGDDFEQHGSESEDFEAILNEGNTVPMHQPPCPMYTQDTWSNIFDPSPPLRTQTQVGWDGRSDFFVGQLFSSKAELQQAMKRYCMLRNHVAKTDRSSPKALVYKCNNDTPCNWRLRACHKENHDMWQITQYTGPHTCLGVNVSQDHNSLDARYMAHELNEIVAKAPGTKIKALQEIVKKLTGGYMPTYKKTWAAKQIVIQNIHDRHPGLLAYLNDDDAYDWRPPHAVHRFCLRHLGANYHRRFGKLVGNEVKIIAMEAQKHKFKAKLNRLQRFANGLVYDELKGLDRKNWTFAYDGGRRYGTETTNVSESFNGVLKEARHLPIMATVMTTFYKCVEYFDDRLVKSMQFKANGNDFSLFAKKKYDRWNDNAVGHNVIVINRAAGLYEVHTPMNPTSPYKGNHKHTVELSMHRCTCNKIQLWKLPCSHVIAVCKKMRLDPRQYFNKYWSIDTTIFMYGSLTFKPLPDVPYWPPYNGPRVLPDTERLRGRGRPRVNRLRTEMDWLESQPPQTCSLCGERGHNRRRCGRVGGPSSS
ncbi:hypothetical protein Vadar_008632 [Vaccinium darrowii]|uniref:Uncharacterized protein n=1 Tax=Vaccinium darrowii TaxID=229202 RepID=A0ACB7Y6T3_9ERIC|nr:hypothetical protein Vadar_008632 [Vaccinium darrowii]